jgi:cytoskeletal protein RodZ
VRSTAKTAKAEANDVGQLGDTLRERRASLGISLETAENETRIRARLLQALEDGEYDRLPNPGYVRGYVSSYARYLELDPVPLLAMYRAETGAGRFHDINVPEQQVAHRHEQHAVPWRVGVIAFVIIAVLAGAGWITYKLVRGPSTPPPLPAPTGTTTSTPPGTRQTSAPPFTLKVKVSTEGASKVKVTVDGGVAYNGTLTAGQSKTFQVAETAVVQVSKPSRVTVTRNGAIVELPTKANAKLTLKASQP